MIWLLVGWAVSSVLVLLAETSDALRPLADPATTPDFQPLVYALDVLVPIVELGQAGFWQPTGPWAIWYWLAILAGWLLAKAFVAGLSAAIRRS